jgi:hypothetical protein
MLTTNDTRIASALVLALSTMAMACAGLEQDQEFDDDITAGDGDGDGQSGNGRTDYDDEDPSNPGDIRSPDPSDPQGPGDIRAMDPIVPEPPEACEPQTNVLFAGQTIDTGTVTVSNTESSFELSVLANAPYQLLEVHAFVGVGPLPTDNDGVAPGQFPHMIEFAEPTDAWQLSIPVTELAAGCGDEVQVAVHAVVVAFEDGAEVFEETAWMFGANEFEGHWGWSLDYGICCE